jgi:hypothetical protein
MSGKRLLRITAAPLLLVLVLSNGCLRNTPKQVAQRFVLNIKDLKWDKMIKMVDWDSTEMYGERLPQGSKKDLVYRFGAVFTKSRFDRLSKAEIKHKLVYMAVDSVELLEEEDDKAKVRIECRLEQKRTDNPKTYSEVDLSLRKVKREWKVVLTPDLFDRGY